MPSKILSAPQIRSIDASTIFNEPTSSIDLMEQASLAFVEAFVREVDPTNKITVFAGCGNNGGDAFAVARILSKRNYKLKVYWVRNAESKLSQDCLENSRRWQNLPQAFLSEIQKEADLECIDFGYVAVDGLFGSGLNRPLSGIYQAVVKKINEQNMPVYSIDIPSGLFVEDNAERKGGVVLCATKTFTFQFPKLAFLLPENGEFVSDFEVLNIRLLPQAIDEAQTDYFFLQQEDIRQLLHNRSRFSHKGTFGHAMLVVGQYGKMGAAIIASKACLRTGVGLLTVHCPKLGVNALQTSIPEAMIDADVDEYENANLPELLLKYTIGIGPGIGKNEPVKQMLEKLLRQADKPLVLDADALNLLAENPLYISLLPENSILTPHPTEFERLANEKYHTGYDRLQSARRLAKQWKVVIVLKGAYTAIVLPNQTVYFNSTGNPGMATGGSGDALTGMITALLAQGYQSAEAAIIGVYLHGLAGDVALSKIGSMEALLATDLIESIGEAFRRIRK